MYYKFLSFPVALQYVQNNTRKQAHKNAGPMGIQQRASAFNMLQHMAMDAYNAMNIINIFNLNLNLTSFHSELRAQSSFATVQITMLYVSVRKNINSSL